MTTKQSLYRCEINKTKNKIFHKNSLKYICFLWVVPMIWMFFIYFLKVSPNGLLSSLLQNVYLVNYDIDL